MPLSRTWRARVCVRRSRSTRPVLPSCSKNVRQGEDRSSALAACTFASCAIALATDAAAGEHLPCSSSKCPQSAECARPFTTSTKRGEATDAEGGEEGFCTVAALSHRLQVLPWCESCVQTRRKSNVNGNSLLAGTPTVACGTSNLPGVWPSGKKRDKRRLSASYALTGKLS